MQFHWLDLEQNQSQRAHGECERDGFFLTKNPFCGIASGNRYSGFALAPLALGAPWLTILFLLVYYLFRRWKMRRALRQGRRLRGFTPSAGAMALAFLAMQWSVRPSLRHVIEVREQVRVEHEDAGDKGPDDAPKIVQSGAPRAWK